jgi:hypothetical protein
MNAAAKALPSAANFKLVFNWVPCEMLVK